MNIKVGSQLFSKHMSTVIDRYQRYSFAASRQAGSQPRLPISRRWSFEFSTMGDDFTAYLAIAAETCSSRYFYSPSAFWTPASRLRPPTNRIQRRYFLREIDLRPTPPVCCNVPCRGPRADPSPSMTWPALEITISAPPMTVKHGRKAWC